MATANLGRVGFVNKGTYSGATAYKVNDVVVYNSGTYACIQANTGQAPTNTSYWQNWVEDNAVHKTGDETIAGVKTFSSTIAGSINGNASTATTATNLSGGTVVVQAPSYAATITDISDTKAKIKANETNVGDSVGYIPLTYQRVKSNSGFVQHISFGTYRPEYSWNNGGAYIAVGGSDSSPTEAFYFKYGGTISNSNGNLKLIGNAETVTNGVYTTGNQIVNGVKTFSSSPIVPTPTTGTHAVNKDYVDNRKTIATGTATFNSTTNNINLTGIGIGVEIGDVIQISGAEDAKNNSEFTIEVITDDDNVIVNQAHANKGTSKNVATRSGDTDVTVKLLAKRYNAPLGIGQAWVDVTTSRAAGTTYTNITGKPILVSVQRTASTGWQLFINSLVIGDKDDGGAGTNPRDTLMSIVPNNGTYYVTNFTKWYELR